MSTGDIDDTVGSLMELRRLCQQFPGLTEYLAQEVTDFDGSYFVPYFGGISEDGNTVYISHHAELIIPQRTLSIAPALIAHERTEWGLREFAGIGVDYEHDPAGHRLANAAEKATVERLGLTWEEYKDFLDPQIIEGETESGDLPPDLAMYPYKGTKWARHGY